MNRKSANTRDVQGIVRRLADEAALIVWEADLDGRCTYLNPETMAGLASPGDVNIAEWAQYVHPEDRARAAETVAEARRLQREYQHEYRILRSDGSARWILSSASPRLSADGRMIGYLGTMIDVSDRHDASDRLARSEAEHRLITESARDLISHCDADSCYVYVSPSHKDILGYEPSEMIGTNVFDYIHPDDLRRSRAQGQQSPQKGTPAELFHLRFRHRNGSWIWLGATTRNVRDLRTGEKSGMVSVARDVTAQFEAQRELARREERFRSLTSLSSDWYWETDEQGRFTFFSEGMYQRLRMRPGELLGTRLHDNAGNIDEPALIKCAQRFDSREPFRNMVITVRSRANPEAVRYLRISGEPFFEDGAFRGYRGITCDVTRDVRAAHEMERLATTDSLTGLPNRALLDARLAQRLIERRNTAQQAVFLIDLDNFKEVNDSLGHRAGDILLKNVAERLRQCVRPDDMVARLGGDEFVVVADCRDGEASAAAIAGKLCAELGIPVLIGSQEVKVGSSIGIGIAPQDGDSSELLLQNADTALYRAKAAGGRRYCFYTAEMGAATKTRLLLQSALRHALERNEFEVHYQPRIDLKTFEMTGMEALLRWNHPQLGSVPPMQFIPLAEEINLIDEIGDWVLRRATFQAREWITRYGKPLRISVNVSARQLRNKDLVSSVAHALDTSCLPAEYLELELTESGLMEDPDLAAGMLRELKELGLHISVDDFGTGYSSLAYLCRFPLDTLKLDRSFLQQHESQKVSPRTLAMAIISMAHTLNMSVVAEGVEFEEHLGFLSNTACDEIQGYLFSPPLPAREFERMLQAPRRQCAVDVSPSALPDARKATAKQGR